MSKIFLFLDLALLEWLLTAGFFMTYDLAWISFGKENTDRVIGIIAFISLLSAITYSWSIGAFKNV